MTDAAGNGKGSAEIKIMTLIRWLIIVGIAVIPAVILGLLAAKAHMSSMALSAKVNETQLEVARSRAELERSLGEKEDFKTNFIKLQQDYKTLETGNENLKTEVRRNVSEKNKTKELEVSLTKALEEAGTLKNERDLLFTQTKGYEEESRKIRAEYDEIVKVKEELERSQNKEVALKLEKERADLTRQRDLAANRIKTLELEIVALRANTSQSVEEASQLVDKISVLSKEKAEAAEKNKALEQRIAQMPIQFAEIALQNKELMKRTANMHYNLGVFYTKKKEYVRAVTEFEKALELRPDDAYSHFNLGFIYSEYVVNRTKAIDHFKQFLLNSRPDDMDADWVRKYLLTWETYEGKEPMK